jgi:hypothetical protein
VEALGKSASLRNASISGGDGLAVKDEGSNVRLRVSPEEGAILAYNATGAVVARYGLLAYSDPGEYGLETLTDNGWSHVGAGLADWAAIDNKPATFTPSAHTHPGADVTSAVASATTATTAALAALADGSQYAFNNTVSGTQFYAVWVGNDGGFHLGRNTSSLRYKDNIRTFEQADDLSGVRLVRYDRRPQLRYPEDAQGQRLIGPPERVPGTVDEFGMIAEEVALVWPEVVTYFDHGDGAGPVIDGIRYDLVGPRLIPHIQKLEARATAAEELAAAQANLISDLTRRLDAIDGGM